MTTDNRYALLSVDGDESQTSTKKTTQKKSTVPTQKTPAERAQQNANRQKTKPPTQNKPQPQDDTGFVTVQSQTKKPQGPQRMNRDSYFKEKSLGRDPIQNIPESPVPQRGENSFRSRGGNKTRTAKRPSGQDEDVNSKSLNKPDFIPGGQRKFVDRPPKSQGGSGSGSGYKGNRGNKQGGNRGGNRQGKRQFDRHSGTGLNNAAKKNEAGGENWGDAVKESPQTPEQDKKVVVEESSESSEYYPEPDEKGEEKKDNVVRKGFSTYVKNLEEEKTKVQDLLERHGVKKEKVEIKTNVPESVSNINKKEKTNLAVEDKNDALFIKTTVPRALNVTPTPTPTATEGKKKYIAATELGFKNKRHRGINRPIEELPERKPRQPRNQNQNQNQNQNVSDKKDNTNVQQNEQNDNKEQQTRSPNQNRGTGNFRGKQSGNRGGKGGKRIFQEDFPSLSNDVVVEEKPQWVQQSNN